MIGFDIERKRYVVADQIEAVVVDDTIDVAAGAGEKVIDADEVSAVLEQALTQMRAEKSGTAVTITRVSRCIFNCPWREIRNPLHPIR